MQRSSFLQALCIVWFYTTFDGLCERLKPQQTTNHLTIFCVWCLKGSMASKGKPPFLRLRSAVLFHVPQPACESTLMHI